MTGFLPALISSGSSLPGSGAGPMPEQPVLGVVDHLAPLGDELGDQFGDADAEVDVGAVGDVEGDALGHLLAGPALTSDRSVMGRSPPSATSRTRAAGSDHDDAVDEDARRDDDFGIDARRGPRRSARLHDRGRCRPCT